ncbi:MAG: hypothetical protein K9K75_00425 [Deltaproteobacteria bacterium]|nr:hypothetical protein [Deltaproteobacteria bacterium]
MRTFPEAKLAGSIIFVREGENGWEVLMGLRSEHSEFVPGAYVFTGGALDVEDNDIAHALFPLAKGRNKKALALKIAAIREAFEEMGILMAHREISPSATTIPERFGTYRQRLLQGERNAFSEMLSEQQLTPSISGLFSFARWVTPPFFPIRYDAQFFVARMPDQQLAIHDGRELVAHIWLPPREMLLRHSRNEFPLVYPTLMTLKALAQFPRIEDLLEKTAKD